MQQLVGKRALITAGASGIGRVIAMRFADEGARVHVCDVSQDALATFATERPDIDWTVADVSDRQMSHDCSTRRWQRWADPISWSTMPESPDRPRASRT